MSEKFQLALEHLAATCRQADAALRTRDDTQMDAQIHTESKLATDLRGEISQLKKQLRAMKDRTQKADIRIGRALRHIEKLLTQIQAG